MPRTSLRGPSGPLGWSVGLRSGSGTTELRELLVGGTEGPVTAGITPELRRSAKKPETSNLSDCQARFHSAAGSVACRRLS